MLKLASARSRGRFVLISACFAAGIASLLALDVRSEIRDGEIDFCRLELAFEDDFDDVSIASRELGDKRWIAHTPWNGDFGDAIFTDPGEDFPFTVEDGNLHITARTDSEGTWRSGLISSGDGQRNGFMTQYGYFEARMKLPPGPGVWPAFWLASSETPGWEGPSIEVDILEYYGHDDTSLQSARHIWHKNPVRSEPLVQPTRVPAGSLTEDFHLYSARVAPDFITYYLDREPIWQIPTPQEHKFPLMLLANLALGSGFPIDKTPNPSVLEIDYIRAYTLLPEARPDCTPGDQ